ncbi:hypothetical protein [Anaerobacillus alkaliphilus]|nr:hypothetical protein [Anaerobacillus alkaliphilus]
MAEKKNTSQDLNKYNKSDDDYQNDRHNDNARATAALEPENPRIDTDSL